MKESNNLYRQEHKINNLKNKKKDIIIDIEVSSNSDNLIKNNIEKKIFKIESKSFESNFKENFSLEDICDNNIKNTFKRFNNNTISKGKSINNNSNLCDVDKEDLNLNFSLNLNENSEIRSSKNINYLDEKTEKLNVEELIFHLSCSICKGIYRNPFSINECMHTFCKKCIFKLINENPKKAKCPQCNIEINKTILEGIQHNIQLDHLINSLFPEFAIIDKNEKVVIDLYKIKRKKTKALIYIF